MCMCKHVCVFPGMYGSLGDIFLDFNFYLGFIWSEGFCIESFSSHVLLAPCQCLGLSSNSFYFFFKRELFFLNQLMKVSLVNIIPFNLFIEITAFCNHPVILKITLLDHS